VVVSGDIHTDFDFATLEAPIAAIERDSTSCVAHFVLVDNPPWHPAGDMGLAAGRVTLEGGARLTYGNIGVFDPRPFRDIPAGTRLKLFPWMYRFVREGRVTGERYAGPWDNVGTPGQLAQLDRRLRR
jgi:MurNAc alpha-1-phosphate uridylyltransferase